MFVVGEFKGIKYRDKLHSCDIKFNLVFVCEQEFQPEMKSIYIDKFHTEKMTNSGYISLASPEAGVKTYFIDYYNFSAGKAAKIAYGISIFEIEEVCQMIFDSYLECIDIEILQVTKELKMTDIFGLGKEN